MGSARKGSRGCCNRFQKNAPLDSSRISTPLATDPDAIGTGESSAAAGHEPHRDPVAAELFCTAILIYYPDHQIPLASFPRRFVRFSAETCCPFFQEKDGEFPHPTRFSAVDTSHTVKNYLSPDQNGKKGFSLSPYLQSTRQRGNKVLSRRQTPPSNA